MSVNYYAVPKKISHNPNIIHIGKLSQGWLFLFSKNLYWQSYEQVFEWLNNYKDSYVILDEYDQEISIENLKNMIDRNDSLEDSQMNKDNFTNCENINGHRFTTLDFI